MSKVDHIAYWVETAEQNWKTIPILFDGSCYVEALFWAHLVLEKLLKAHWVKDNIENVPPKTHNLSKLVAQTKIILPDEYLIILAKLNDIQLEGRYPEYKKNIYKIYKKEQTAIVLDQIKEIRICLLNNLQ